MDRKINKPIDGGSATSIHFDAYSGGKKSVALAPKLIHMPMSQSNTESISKGSTVYVFNKSNELEWLLLTNDIEHIESPDFGPNWFPLKPMDWTILNSGDNQKIGTSSDQVGVYLVYDDTSLK
jgi:hypothetical protein